MRPRCDTYRQLWVAHSRPAVFDFFSRAENLEQITPPWMRFRILTPATVEMKQGATISYSLRVRRVPLRWLREIESWNPPFEFIDVQAKGPYKFWRHTHAIRKPGQITCPRKCFEHLLYHGLHERWGSDLMPF
jgi:ligand-binding SRPBCC domain-containing protein